MEYAEKEDEFARRGEDKLNQNEVMENEILLILHSGEGRNVAMEL